MPRPTRRYLKMWRSIIKPEMLGCPAISRTIPKNVCPQIPTVLRTLKDTLWLGGTEAFGNLQAHTHTVLFPIFLPLMSSLHYTYITFKVERGTDMAQATFTSNTRVPGCPTPKARHTPAPSVRWVIMPLGWERQTGQQPDSDRWEPSDRF